MSVHWLEHGETPQSIRISSALQPLLLDCVLPLVLGFSLAGWRAVATTYGLVCTGVCPVNRYQTLLAVLFPFLSFQSILPVGSALCAVSCSPLCGSCMRLKPSGISARSALAKQYSALSSVLAFGQAFLASRLTVRPSWRRRCSALRSGQRLLGRGWTGFPPDRVDSC